MPHPTPEVPVLRGLVQSFHGFGSEMKPNWTFQACLKVDGFSRGRSSAKVILKDPRTGITYEMFLIDFIGEVKTAGWPVTGRWGTWTWCKRGKNYGLFRSPEEESAIE